MVLYTPEGINDVLTHTFPHWVKRPNSSVFYANCPVSFDIETTSTYAGGEKFAFMYVWTLDIDGKYVMGRTWKEFVSVINEISKHFGCSDVGTVKRHIIVWVHNLAYEFQFIRYWFHWSHVFSLKKRKPLYAVTTNGIEFRCSYRLSGYPLYKIGEQVGIEKLPDFDYKTIRHSKTPLTMREKQYCVNDVRIVSAYIRKKIEQEKYGIASIPLTKTGYVRRRYREATLKGSNRCFYIEAIKGMTLTPEEYTIARFAFAGGFTHCSFLHSNRKRLGVTSCDFASSYPAVLVAEKYPMKAGEKIEQMSVDEFKQHIHDEDLMIFTIELLNVRQKFPCESYISESRCSTLEGELNPNPKRTKSGKIKAGQMYLPKSLIINNGRVFKAKRLVTTITSIDMQIIDKIYDYDLSRFSDCYIYHKEYLPTSFIKTLLELYGNKTKLKGVKGKEEEYMNAKEDTNASYGMTVTDIVRDEIKYYDETGWEPPENEKEMTKEQRVQWLVEQIEKENGKKNRFLFYLWGVFCTAYARRNLFTGILECRYDYIYSDTDSVKILNYDDHKEYFDRYNWFVTKKIEKALKYHNLPLEMARPKTIKGVEKPLGVWEIDGHYSEFKALRAKAYAYIEDGEFHITVAGLPKEWGAHYFNELAQQNGTSPVDEFHREVVVPKTYSYYDEEKQKKIEGKLTHTYIDDTMSAIVTDFNGIKCAMFERSSVHLEPCDFKLSIASQYLDFLNGYTNVYE